MDECQKLLDTLENNFRQLAECAHNLENMTLSDECLGLAGPEKLASMSTMVNCCECASSFDRLLKQVQEAKDAARKPCPGSDRKTLSLSGSAPRACACVPVNLNFA